MPQPLLGHRQGKNEQSEKRTLYLPYTPESTQHKAERAGGPLHMADCMISMCLFHASAEQGGHSENTAAVTSYFLL